MLRDRCKRRGAEIAAAGYDDSAVVEASAVRDGSGFHVLSARPERRELEPSYAVVCVDS